MKTAPTMSEKLTIILTDRAPVTVTKDKWPLIAEAKEWDSEHESQATRIWKLSVRQHDDGRTIVYGTYWSRYRKERGLEAGELLPAGDDIPATIKRVATNCRCEKIADACISDLPPVDLDE